MTSIKFRDREEAGLLLAKELERYRDTDAVVLTIPRGGVPVGAVIAGELHLPLDIILTRKIGHPVNKEFAIGAVSLDDSIIDEIPDISPSYIAAETKKIRELLQKRAGMYRGDRGALPVKGKTVILVDDGIATGNTLLMAIRILRKQQAAKIVVASPVVPNDRVGSISESVDEFIYLMAPVNFSGVGAFYEEFTQVSDEEVIRSLSSVSV